MPSLKQAVPKYRKHRASGQAVVTLSGVDHYLGPHGTKASLREYDRLIAEWLARGRSPQLQERAAVTVVEVSVPAAEFGPLALKDFRERLIGRDLSKSSVNRAIARVRRAFRWAVADELVPVAVVTALEAVEGLRSGQGARDTAPVQPVDDAAVDATLPHLPEVVANIVRPQRVPSGGRALVADPFNKATPIAVSGRFLQPADPIG